MHQTRLAKLFPRDAEMHSMLGGVLNNLGFIYQKLGDEKAALETYREAVEYQSNAVKLAPEVARYREYLMKHRTNLEADHRDSLNQAVERYES